MGQLSGAHPKYGVPEKMAVGSQGGMAMHDCFQTTNIGYVTGKQTNEYGLSLFL